MNYNPVKISIRIFSAAGKIANAPQAPGMSKLLEHVSRSMRFFVAPIEYRLLLYYTAMSLHCQAGIIKFSKDDEVYFGICNWSKQNLYQNKDFRTDFLEKVVKPKGLSAKFQNKELKKQTRCINLFPNKEFLLRIATALLLELDETWLGESKRYIRKIAGILENS